MYRVGASGENQSEGSALNGRNLRSTFDPVGFIRLILSTSYGGVSLGRHAPKPGRRSRVGLGIGAALGSVSGLGCRRGTRMMPRSARWRPQWTTVPVSSGDRPGVRAEGPPNVWHGEVIG